MKTYRHLFEEIISDENIERAINKACRGKKSKKKKRALLEIKDDHDKIKKVRENIVNYETIPHEPKSIYDGITKKVRIIYVPTAMETVIQHAVVQVLSKYLNKGTYEHTYAAIPGRGQLKAKKRLEKWIRDNPKDIKYYLKMDIKQYFPSVPQKKVMGMLERRIKDYRALGLIQKILAVAPDGIPLGFYISQWLANWYLQGLDHYAKESLLLKIYMRWMDDIVIFNSNKRKLHGVKDTISGFLDKIGLRLKENWRIALFSYGEEPGAKKPRQGVLLDYMGYRFYRCRTTLRESIFYRMVRKARRIGRKEKPTIYEIKQFISYIGWMSYSSVYKAYEDYIKPYVNIQQCKRRISRYDRRQERRGNGVAYRTGYGVPGTYGHGIEQDAQLCAA